MAINMAILSDQRLVLNAWAALVGMAPGSDAFSAHTQYVRDNGAAAFTGALSGIFAGVSDADLAAAMLTNLHLTDVFTQADAEVYLAANAADRVGAMVYLAELLYTYAGTDATILAAQSAYQDDIDVSFGYSGSAANPNPGDIDAIASDGELFSLNGSTADVMRITGDQDVRIDFTNPANQVTGLDLDGDGVVRNDGEENAITGRAANFEIVDAYARNPLNHYDRTSNFLGDINFDGTGFGGDGVSTDGNIFLGGLGADKAYGGIGNDFLAGGGVGDLAGGTRDTLLGGRNADFFFAELSDLTPVDGDVLVVDGGRTADDTAAGDTQSAQDADWLLLEASDDDEPVTIVLNEGNELKDNLSPNVTTASGRSMTTYDVENLNASGYLYGFLDAMNVQIGGRSYDNRDAAIASDVADYGDTNYGLGSSAQMSVTGSSAANTVIAGYDNDVVYGMGGNDLLFGGDLRFIKTHNNNPNLANITNDGMDRLFGGDGDDNLVWEVDGGTYAGDAGNDTLFVTNYSIGRTASTEAGTANAQLDATGTGYDSQVLRIDLGYATYRGYRGDTLGEGTDHSDEANDTSTSNHRAGTADQTNYAGGSATTVTGTENVIASGMGAIDYSADGSNNSDAAGFVQQQNYRGSALNMELRGTDGTPVVITSQIGGRDGLSPDEIDQLYAQYLVNIGVIYDDNDPNTTEQILTKEEFTELLDDGELTYQSPTTYTTVVTYNGGANVLYAGTGNDILEGRAGNDSLMGNEGNDDFVFQLTGEDSGDGVDVIHRQTETAAGSNLTTGTFGQDFGLDSTSTSANSTFTLGLPSTLASYVDGFRFTLDGTEYVVDGLTAANFAAWVANLEDALDTTAGLGDLVVTTPSEGVVVLTDPAGGTFVEHTTNGWILTSGSLPSDGLDAWYQQVGAPTVDSDEDRLIYKAYEDRTMNEGVDDDAVLGSTISLGSDNYAEDLVIDFSADGTRIAEDQQYGISFADLKVEDIVRIQINGVIYELQVGKALDGTLIANESNNAFVARMATYINNFMDDDTAVGAVDATSAGNTLSLTQRAYNGEETVFMKTPVVTLTNLSGGQAPVATVTNYAQHEVHLLDFDGRNGNLDRDNVLFVGEEFTNRAALQTAQNAGGTINGYEAMVIDSIVDDLAGIEANLASTFSANFSVHGDDFLLGGDGNDTINGLTGDDRIEGSRGTDTLDGGKNWYAVQVLGEAEARVVYMNGWEAGNPAARVSELAGKTISSTTLIGQSESGASIVDGYFNDTLVFEQRDFVAGVTDFTIKLDGFAALPTTATFRSVEFRNDGAGHVETDVNGDNVIGSNITTFSNFENIRTVSGINRAVAGDGQGNDTLDISALSNATFGVSYDLTNRGTAGDVNFTTADEVVDAVVANANTAAGDRTVEADYVEVDDIYVMKVDGVENVIGGTGDDLVMIDETEAAKNNLFSGGLGTDRIEYLNSYTNGDADEPTVTVRVNTATDTDQVVMTRGALGLVEATDTLTGVEYIALNGNTAEGVRENDVVDVTAMASGAVVDYTNGEVRTGLAVGSGVQVVIENIFEIENVWADGNDTVIVADAATMNDNARSDETAPATASEDIQLATYLDFDQTNAGGYGGNGTQRVAFAAQTGADIANVINQNQFTFDMSRVGTAADVDTIDYSNETGHIVAVMNFNADDEDKFVLVDGDSDNDFTDAESRVDHLISVERIVAASGANSTIDVTNSDRDVNIVFSYNQPNQKVNFVEGTHKIAALDRQINVVRVSDADDQAALGNVDLLEYRDLGDSTTIAQTVATWESVEGSDYREYVQLTQWEDDINHGFNLRGGQNEVNYNERTNGIELVINSVDATVNGIGNQFSLTVKHLDAVGAWNGGEDTIYGFASDNTFDEADGARLDTLRIEASQGDMDLINVLGIGEAGIFILGNIETSGDSVVTATFGGEGTGLVMSGFEYLWDAGEGTGGAPIDDVYVIDDLSGFVSKMTLIDYDQTVAVGVFTGSADRDTIKLTNGAFETAVVRPPVSHSITIGADLHMGDGDADDLQWLGVNNNTDRAALAVAEGLVAGSVGFDFQVLDISAVTATATGGSLADAITADGSAINADEEIILGNLDLIQTAGTAITNFDIISLTNNSAGTTFNVNLDTSELRDATNAKIFGFADTDGLDTLDLSRITGRNMTVTVTDVGAAGFEVIGTAGTDTITGGAGADTIQGGAGADVLDGNIVPAVGATYTVTLSGVTATSGANGDSMTIAGMTLDTATTPAAATDIAVGADADQIGAAFAAQTLVSWQAALLADGLTAAEAGALLSVTYNATSNELVFAFDTTLGGSTLVTTGNLINQTTAPAVTGTAVLGATEAETDFIAQGNSADTFVYTAATDSTAAAMDVISNFNIDAGTGSVDDIIDLSAFADLEGLAADLTVNNTAAADFAAIQTAAEAANDEVYVGRTATDAYVLVDSNDDGTMDMAIKLAGVTTVAGFTVAENLAF